VFHGERTYFKEQGLYAFILRTALPQAGRIICTSRQKNKKGEPFDHLFFQANRERTPAFSEWNLFLAAAAASPLPNAKMLWAIASVS
jgi:hypothetical protein